ncbi:glycosyltransferase [Candidatus Poribacteria bacterium]|nr:glycosyltransferase [Candidatus Poribacteria bacterium]
MINILYLNYSMDVGGIEKMILDFVRNIDRTAFCPHVGALRNGGALEGEIRSAGASLHNLRYEEGIDLPVVFQLERLMRKERIDVLHTNNYGAWFYGTLANVRWRAGHVHTEHSKIENIWRRKWLERRLTSLTDTVVAVSDRVRGHMAGEIRIAPEKIKLIYNGVDIRKFARAEERRLEGRRNLGIKEGDTLYGIVARLEAVKDHAVIIRAFSRVKAVRPGARLVIVGGGSLKGALSELSRELGLEGEIIFTGERSDVPDLLNAMDVYVLASRDEGLNLTLLEAMSCELPVIATCVGGNPEVVVDGGTGLLVAPRDDYSFGEAMLRLLDNLPERMRMGSEGRSRVVSLFSLERMIRAYQNLYTEEGLRRKSSVQ